MSHRPTRTSPPSDGTGHPLARDVEILLESEGAPALLSARGEEGALVEVGLGVRRRAAGCDKIRELHGSDLQHVFFFNPADLGALLNSPSAGLSRNAACPRLLGRLAVATDAAAFQAALHAAAAVR